jgi:hypothetical protein
VQKVYGATDGEDTPEWDGHAAKRISEHALASVRARLGALRDAREELNRSVIAQRKAINDQIRELVVQEDFLERMVRLGEQMAERIDDLPNTERNTDDGGTEGSNP